MSTVVDLDIFTGPYPSIGNNIEVRVYMQSAPLAVLDALNHPFPHTVQDIWSFPGLPRVNLLFRVFETTGGLGSSIIQQLGGDMNVTPGSANGVNFRATEQIEADVTVGFVSGVNSVTFDGTAGAEDWRGWEISTLDRMGTGPMKKGVDYTWNKTLGKLQLLNIGDVFGPNEWFNVEFEAQTSQVTASLPSIVFLFDTPKLITADYTVSAGGDMGGLLILDPASTYLEVSLPDLNTVLPGRLLTIEMRRASVNKCGKIITFMTDTIDWLQGSRNDLYICPQESLSLYRFVDPGGAAVGMWRVYNPSPGNWLQLGHTVDDDNILANVFNKVLTDGSDGDVLALARLYNDYVAQLPGGQVVNYDDWTTGNNKYKFSLANSANLANAGKFKIPDRRNIFKRNTDGTRLPGDFQAQSIQAHNHGVPVAVAPTDPNTGVNITGGRSGSSGKQGLSDNTGGSETKPANIAGREYLLV
jgi:hypothetical protein